MLVVLSLEVPPLVIIEDRLQRLEDKIEELEHLEKDKENK
jgi:hypothetical protein